MNSRKTSKKDGFGELLQRTNKPFKTALAAKRFIMRMEWNVYQMNEISAWRARWVILGAATTTAEHITTKKEGAAFAAWFEGWFAGLAAKYNEREIRRILPR